MEMENDKDFRNQVIDKLLAALSANITMLPLSSTDEWAHGRNQIKLQIELFKSSGDLSHLLRI
ncbi:1839_t:CDS:2 [Gigaspora rosea]|nr:1839_t:CDS:2 [Gigaspora rosea]